MLLLFPEFNCVPFYSQTLKSSSKSFQKPRISPRPAVLVSLFFFRTLKIDSIVGSPGSMLVSCSIFANLTQTKTYQGREALNCGTDPIKLALGHVFGYIFLIDN